MASNTTYKAISARGINEFNDKLREYTEIGFVPFGGISSSDGSRSDLFSVLLCKTEKTEYEPELLFEGIYDKAVKYAQEHYANDSKGIACMLIGDVANLITEITGKQVDWKQLQIYG
jgi:hypothetical protein